MKLETTPPAVDIMAYDTKRSAWKIPFSLSSAYPIEYPTKGIAEKDLALIALFSSLASLDHRARRLGTECVYLDLSDALITHPELAMTTIDLVLSGVIRLEEGGLACLASAKSDTLWLLVRKFQAALASRQGGAST